jgi:hypothetical protein
MLRKVPVDVQRLLPASSGNPRAAMAGIVCARPQQNGKKKGPPVKRPLMRKESLNAIFSPGRGKHP